MNVKEKARYLGLRVIRVAMKSVKYGLAGYVLLLKQIKQNRALPSDCVCLDLSRNHFGRHLFSVLWSFERHGYAILIKNNQRLLVDMAASKYMRFILQSNSVFLVKKFHDNSCTAMLTDQNIRPDPYQFYSGEIADKLSEECFSRIPMMMHPGMYINGYWNREVYESERHRRLFFAGFMSEMHYSRGEFNEALGVLSRPRIAETLKDITLLVGSDYDLSKVLSSHVINESVILVDVSLFLVSQADIRQVLSGFDYFLAMPGAIKPMCHNVTEAMSVGCIPVIQQNYAEMFPISLVHGENAICFSGEEDLQCAINIAIGAKDSEVHKLRKNVIEYYEREMTPKAVVDTILGREQSAVVYMPSLRPE